ncbi:MAG: ATP-binding protein, partial [Candidatus Nanoarchaeia archaeon]|nr:ATP-binding protein [Candidatus Nanoarchaeia archaeon]
IINDFQAPNKFKKGYPKGHAHLSKYMTFPVFSGKEIIGVVGLANKKLNYTKTDLLQATLLMQSVYREVDKKKSEEKIIQLKNDYESIFESSNDILIIFDKDGKISKLNKAFEKTFNKKKQDLIKKSINDLKLLDIKGERVFFDTISKKLLNNTFETKINGFVFSAILNTINSESGKKSFQLSLRNITQEKEMEKIKEFNDRILLKKMEEENMIKLKNQLLMRVSHELRHPLVPIVGYASVMLEENPSDIQEKYLQKIIQNSNYLKDLINKVLDVINFETGEAKINTSTFKINELVEKTIFENETKADLKGIKIVKKIKKIGNVILDENKIHLVVSNILDNAIKFTDSGKITVSLDDQKKHFIIGISDTGKGMTDEEITRIFSYSQNEDYSNLNMGLGLGLILSKYIVRAHNGEMRISSVPKKGTDVKIILPKVVD